jgi:hypothetical protein
MPTDPSILTLEIVLDADTDRAALEQALLRARATELGEVRRHEVRLSAGYGDATTRATMSEELARARTRWTVLDRLLTAVRSEQTLGSADG